MSQHFGRGFPASHTRFTIDSPGEFHPPGRSRTASKSEVR